MAGFETIFRGGIIVNSEGSRSADVAVQNGRIAAILVPGTSAPARREINIRGKCMIPGLVDAHVHFREPGLTQNEDFGSGSLAAIVGGVTTALVMPTDAPWTVTPAHFRQKASLAQGKIHCDVGLQIAVQRSATELEKLRDLGAVSYEVFTADVPENFLHADSAAILEALRRVSLVGGLCGLSPQDAGATSTAVLKEQLEHPLTAFLSKYPPHGEAVGVARNIALAAQSGTRVHIRQISTAVAVEILARLKSYADVTVEASVQNLSFTEDDYARFGIWAKASPPFRDRRDVQALREAAASGLIDMIVSDHAPYSPDEKRNAPDFASVPGGMPGIQSLLPAMLSLIDRNVIRLEDMVRLCCEAPAKRFGLSSKGRIEVGMDADLIILDSNKTWTVRNADQVSKAGYTLFDGLTVQCSIDAVFLRGQSVLEPDTYFRPSGKLLNRTDTT